MGLSSSQARLLSLTGRQHDIEYKAQKLEAQKLQMANESTQVYTEYEDALNSQKIQYKTIGADGTATYIDATAANLTTYNPVSNPDKQRFIKNSDGEMIVSGDVKTAYDSCGSSVEAFLLKLGYSFMNSNISNISATKATIQSSNAYTDNTCDANRVVGITISERDTLGNQLKSIRASLVSSENEIKAKAQTVTDPTEKATLTTLANNIAKFIVNLDIDTNWITVDTEHAEDQDLLKLLCTGTAGTMSGSMLASEAPSYGVDLNFLKTTGGNVNLPTILTALANYSTQYNTNAEKNSDSAGGVYYTNIYNEIVKSGGCVSISDANMNSSKWLQSQVDGANIFLYACNSTAGNSGIGSSGAGVYTDTVEISVATDTSLQEVSDDREFKKAEAKYESSMAKIDAKDKKFDTDIATLDTERSAIKTEIDTLKTVAKDNIDRTFKLFS